MSRTRDIIDGIKHLFKGFAFLAGNPRLWVLAIIPTIINLAILALMAGVFIHYYGALSGWLGAQLGIGDISNATAWWQHIVNALLWVAGLILKLLVALLSLVLILIVSYALSFIVAGPFNDSLSERVEVLATGAEQPPFAFGKFLADILRTVRVESIKAGILIAIPIVLFVFSFIPAIGAPIYIVATFIFGAWDLGFSYSDIPFGRRAAPFKTRWEFARKNKWALMGFGIGFAVPFFALVFAAPMVVGGTLLFIERQRRG